MTAPRINFAALPLTICVSGSRAFPRREWVEAFARSLRPGTLLVHGGCPSSPDEYAEAIIRRIVFTERQAAGYRLSSATPPPETTYPLPKVFLAKWKPNGPKGPMDKGAGPKRNQEMLEWVRSEGGALVAFGRTDPATDRLTSGTADAARRAKALGVPSYVVIVQRDGSVRHELDGFDGYLKETP